ncbi:uncharacterized protein LOC102803140 [Saccoglossus kowalevskii]|uniref:RING-type E3 ubiquitin transferase n=1 Tax=Saccoglossus kowalevskii TaxID=10224 RepID=A0ABM0LZL4_SACKO|nr:PREDICTED: E3 ubiquitin-protein ligase RNF169-like [Saccoglossus kowalevskii]
MAALREDTSSQELQLSSTTVVNMTDLQLSECLCPICMSILIEPVTMPCSHELCMPCFRENVEQANFTCPMCRVRISSWARKKTREKKLINQKRWESILSAFPEKCRRRIEGLEDESQDEEISSPSKPHLCEPGEVRREYEKEMKKLQELKKKEAAMEIRASEELIRQLQEEEKRQIEERKRSLQLQRLRDEELAKKLSHVYQDDDVLFEPEQIVVTDEELAKRLNDEINDTYVPVGDEELAKKLQNELDEVHSPGVHGTSKKRSASGGKKNRPESSPSIAEFFSKSQPSRSTSSDITSPESCILVECMSEPVPYRSSSEMTSNSGMSVQNVEQGKLTPVNVCGRSSNTSIDSISPEMNHFKPIHVSPRTPPKRLSNGKLQQPVIVYSTPLNLNKTRFNSNDDNDWLQSSPLVMARWLSLTEERKRQVENQSKATMTNLEFSRISPHTVNVFKKEGTAIIPNLVERQTAKKNKASATISSSEHSSETPSKKAKHNDKRAKAFNRSNLKMECDPFQLPPVLVPQQSISPNQNKLGFEMPVLQSQTDSESSVNFKVAVGNRNRTLDKSGNVDVDIRHTSNKQLPTNCCMPRKETRKSKARTIKDMFVGDSFKSKSVNEPLGIEYSSNKVNDKMAQHCDVSTEPNLNSICSTKEASMLEDNAEKHVSEIFVKEHSDNSTDKNHNTPRKRGRPKKISKQTAIITEHVTSGKTRSSNNQIEMVSKLNTVSEPCTSKLDLSVEGSCSTPRKCRFSRENESVLNHDIITHEQREPQPLHNSTNANNQSKRQLSGDRKSSRNKKIKTCHRGAIDEFANPNKTRKLSQEEIDFQLALKLQQKFDTEQRSERNQVNRTRGSQNAYMLRKKTRSPSSDPGLDVT